MKTLNRVMGGVKLVGGLGMFVSAIGLTGGWALLAPLVGIGAGTMIASGAYTLLTGKFDK